MEVAIKDDKPMNDFSQEIPQGIQADMHTSDNPENEQVYLLDSLFNEVQFTPDSREPEKSYAIKILTEPLKESQLQLFLTKLGLRRPRRSKEAIPTAIDDGNREGPAPDTNRVGTNQLYVAYRDKEPDPTERVENNRVERDSPLVTLAKILPPTESDPNRLRLALMETGSERYTARIVYPARRDQESYKVEFDTDSELDSPHPFNPHAQALNIRSTGKLDKEGKEIIEIIIMQWS